MQSPESVAAKRKLLVEALTLCLSRSKVKEVVPMESIESILQSASGELWREGEFRLEMVWKILCQQPGLSAQEVAPPLLVFKSFEKSLGVHVRMPQALTALPKSEQATLREQLTLTQEEFDQAVAKMADASSEAKPEPTHAEVAKQAVEAAEPVKKPKKPATLQQKILATAAAVVALGAVCVSAMLTLQDKTLPADVTDVAGILKLSEGRRLNKTLVAQIADPRWETLPKEEQRRLAQQLFEKEQGKGIQVLTLNDAQGRVRVTVDNLAGKTVVLVH